MQTKYTISPVNVEERSKTSLAPGATVRVWQRVIDRVIEKDKVKEKTRLQAFEGLVLARKHGREAGATFMVRRVIDGVGVERIFPLYSPLVEKIEILRRAKVRRAKLYHIRKKAAKEVRREMRSIIVVKAEPSQEPVFSDDKLATEQTTNSPKGEKATS